MLGGIAVSSFILTSLSLHFLIFSSSLVAAGASFLILNVVYSTSDVTVPKRESTFLISSLFIPIGVQNSLTSVSETTGLIGFILNPCLIMKESVRLRVSLGTLASISRWIYCCSLASKPTILSPPGIRIRSNKSLASSS